MCTHFGAIVNRIFFLQQLFFPGRKDDIFFSFIAMEWIRVNLKVNIWERGTLIIMMITHDMLMEACSIKKNIGWKALRKEKFPGEKKICDWMIHLFLFRLSAQVTHHTSQTSLHNKNNKKHVKSRKKMEMHTKNCDIWLCTKKEARESRKKNQWKKKNKFEPKIFYGAGLIIRGL